jgi:hypothetical protein
MVDRQSMETYQDKRKQLVCGNRTYAGGRCRAAGDLLIRVAPDRVDAGLSRGHNL